jgi:hypothetical protein
MNRLSFLKRKIYEKKNKIYLLKKAEENKLNCFDLYMEQTGDCLELFFKSYDRVDRSKYSGFLDSIKDRFPNVNLKIDKTSSSIDPTYLLKNTFTKIKEPSMLTRQVVFLTRKLSKMEEVEGYYLSIKGKISSIRKQKRIYKEGRISYTGNYLKDKLRESTCCFSTKKGVIGFKLKIFLK